MAVYDPEPYRPEQERVRITAQGYARLARVERDPLTAARWRLLACLKVAAARRTLIERDGVDPDAFAGLPLIPDHRPRR